MSNAPTDPWTEFFEQVNAEFTEAVEQNLEAQAEFVEAVTESVGTGLEDGTYADAGEGYARAYEVWMDAAAQMVDRASDAVEGEDVDLEEFRDIWLNAANDAYKEAMSTTAFASTTGETVAETLELQQSADEAAETTLHSLGFATESDLTEVGERLVELERRQHAVERKLDRIIEEL
jgi:hypothetical protein